MQNFYQGDINNSYNYAFPLGSYQFNFNYNRSKYRRGVDGINAKYLSNGLTKSKTIGINKVIARNKNNKYQVFTKVTHKDSENYFDGNLIGISSYKTTQLQVKLTHIYLDKWGAVDSAFNIYKGLNWLGARDDNYISNEIDAQKSAKLKFTKYNITTSLTTNLAFKLQLNNLFSWQYTKDNLYDNDKFSIGSSSSVRGYRSGLLVNKGFYLHNTISKNFNINFNKRLLTNINLGLGLDYGRSIGNGKELYGIGFIVKTNSNNLSANFTWAQALKRLSSIQDKTTFNANVNWRF